MFLLVLITNYLRVQIFAILLSFAGVDLVEINTRESKVQLLKNSK